MMFFSSPVFVERKVSVPGNALLSLLPLQIALEDIDVVIEPLQILLLDRSDALEHFVGVERSTSCV